MKHAILFILVLNLNLETFGQNPWDKDFTKADATEEWEPLPPIVIPGAENAPPSDAIILFDGNNLDNWVMSKDNGPCQWNLASGEMTIKLKTGDIQTKQKFGDAQLHIEFRIPGDSKNSEKPYDSGNSGVFIQERYEVQIFDSYQNEVAIYANGQIGSVYKQVIPMVNASNKPGEWNTFDIYYSAPRFNENGSVQIPAYITLTHNGVLTLNHFQIQGLTQHKGIPQYEPHGKASLKLQGHGSEVSFRNIWIREL